MNKKLKRYNVVLLLIIITLIVLLSCNMPSSINKGKEDGIVQEMQKAVLTGVTVEYTVTNDWGAGFTADVKLINNSGSDISGWTVSWTFSNNQTIINLWNGSLSSSGSDISVSNVDWNKNIPIGGQVNFGFQGTYSGINNVPVSFTVSGNSSSSSSSSSSSIDDRKPIPGKIEAEDWDDMYGVQTESCSEGTLNVGWIDSGDWLDYNVKSALNSTYIITLRVANLYDTGKIDILIDNIYQKTITIPNTAGWQEWTSIITEINMTEGNHTIRLYASGSPWNLNWFQFETHSSSSSSSISSSSSSSSSSSDGWNVVWEDTFDGSGAIDRSNWNYHLGNGWNNDLAAFQGWGNGEWEWYAEENVYRENGNLVIKADYNENPTSIAGRDWYQFSGRITTHGLKSWKYGRVEARISIPSIWGTWPAFWMMGDVCDATVNAASGTYDIMATNWSSCGEIDIMEHRNLEDVVTHNYFWDSRTGVYPWADGMNNYNATEDAYVGNVTEFHLYTLEWDENQLRWYIDRDTNPTPTKTVEITAENQEEFHKKFFIILNLAISGQFTGYAEPNIDDFPVYMYVDYVRVWQKN